MQRDDKVSISEMLWWGLIGTIVAGAVLLCGAAFGQTTPPNVLVVVLDDVRTDDVEQVPQVGEIAARGTSFTRAMATFALCTPSRASILSGNYPSTHLVRSNRIALFDPSSTMATWFDAAGYTTGLFGKYGNGMKYLAEQPPGWDVFRAFLNHRDHHEAQSATLGAEVADFIESAPEPFFAYLAPVLPHGPLPGPTECAGTVVPPFVASPGFDEGSRDRVETVWAKRGRRFCGLRQTLTMAFAALDRRGAASRTIVAIMADNGFMLGEHGETGKNVLYEQAIHVPLAIAGPGVPVGVRPGIVSLADVAPTVAELAGVAHPPVDGRAIFSTATRNYVPIEAWDCTGKRRRDSKTVTCGTEPTLVYDLVADPWELYPTVQP